MKSGVDFKGESLMRVFSALLQVFISSRRASTAIEYTLIAAGVALAIASVVFVLGDTVFAELFSGIAESISQ